MGRVSRFALAIAAALFYAAGAQAPDVRRNPAPQKEIRRTRRRSPSSSPRAKRTACGPGCTEWIAADGTIDAGAPGRLRALLAKLGSAQPADLFPLAGRLGRRGDGDRAHDARTRHDGGRRAHHSAGLRRAARPETACDALKRNGRELASELRTVQTLCNSSCIYALIGAKVREVTAGARVGVHAIALGAVDEGGQIKPIIKETPSRTDAANLKRANEQLAQYIAEMGIDRGLFEAAAGIRHERRALHQPRRDRPLRDRPPGLSRKPLGCRRRPAFRGGQVRDRGARRRSEAIPHDQD